MNRYDTNKHTKTVEGVEVEQERIWKTKIPHKHLYVWEDGYDAIAVVEFIPKVGKYLWWNRASECGFETTLELAKEKALGKK